MLEIRSLEPARAMAGDQVPSSWGVPHQLVLLGILLLLAGLVGAGMLFWLMPAPPTAMMIEVNQDRIDAASPLESVYIYRKVFRPGLDPERMPVQKAYEAKRIQFVAGIVAFGVFSLLGAGLMAAGLRMRLRRGAAMVAVVSP